LPSFVPLLLSSLEEEGDSGEDNRGDGGSGEGSGASSGGARIGERGNHAGIALSRDLVVELALEGRRVNGGLGLDEGSLEDVADLNAISGGGRTITNDIDEHLDEVVLVDRVGAGLLDDHGDDQREAREHGGLGGSSDDLILEGGNVADLSGRSGGSRRALATGRANNVNVVGEASSGSTIADASADGLGSAGGTVHEGATAETAASGSDALVAGEASAVVAVDDAAVDLEDGVATAAVVSSASSRGVSGALGDIARVDEAVVGGSTVGASGDGGLHSARVEALVITIDNGERASTLGQAALGVSKLATSGAVGSGQGRGADLLLEVAQALSTARGGEATSVLNLALSKAVTILGRRGRVGSPAALSDVSGNEGGEHRALSVGEATSLARGDDIRAVDGVIANNVGSGSAEGRGEASGVAGAAARDARGVGGRGRDDVGALGEAVNGGLRERPVALVNRDGSASGGSEALGLARGSSLASEGADSRGRADVTVAARGDASEGRGGVDGDVALGNAIGVAGTNEAAAAAQDRALGGGSALVAAGDDSVDSGSTSAGIGRHGDAAVKARLLALGVIEDRASGGGGDGSSAGGSAGEVSRGVAVDVRALTIDGRASSKLDVAAVDALSVGVARGALEGNTIGSGRELSSTADVLAVVVGILGDGAGGDIDDRRELGVALLDAGVEEGVNGEEAAGAGSVRGERAPSVVNLALVLAASVGGRLASEARVGLRGGEVGRGASILAASVGEGSASRGRRSGGRGDGSGDLIVGGLALAVADGKGSRVAGSERAARDSTGSDTAGGPGLEASVLAGGKGGGLADKVGISGTSGLSGGTASPLARAGERLADGSSSASLDAVGVAGASVGAGAIGISGALSSEGALVEALGSGRDGDLRAAASDVHHPQAR